MTGHANVCQPEKKSQKFACFTLFAVVMVVTSVAMGAILASGLLLVQETTVRADLQKWTKSTEWTHGTCTIHGSLPSDHCSAGDAGGGHRRRRLLASSATSCAAGYAVLVVPDATTSAPTSAPTTARRRRLSPRRRQLLAATSSGLGSNESACYYPCGMTSHYSYDASALTVGVARPCWYDASGGEHHYDVKLTNVKPSRMLDTAALDVRKLAGSLLIPLGIVLLLPAVAACIGLKIMGSCAGHDGGENAWCDRIRDMRDGDGGDGGGGVEERAQLKGEAGGVEMQATQDAS